ncbi:serine threonine protein kinase, partial [Colletotrichum sojae]
MDPASLALGVVAIFKDTYVTAKFIKKTIQSINGYQAEQSSLVMRYTVQIYRLKNLSRLFRAADGNTVDLRLLETVPGEYLNTVREVLAQLQRVLSKYATHAAYLDDDYRRFSPLNPHFHFDPVRDTLEIDDTDGKYQTGNSENTSEEVTDGRVTTKSKWWPFRGIGRMSTKITNSSRRLVSLKSLPQGMQWAFQKSALQETLREFEEWNKDLEHLIAPLLVGFGFYDENRNPQDRLRADGDENIKVNIFQGHVDLNKLANNQPSGTLQDSRIVNDDFISCNTAKEKASEARVFLELKQIAASPKHEGGATTSASDRSNITRPMQELYGPQLARLLRTAGEHSFRTLPFNSYAWDGEKAQYIYLFDYPQGTSDRKPKSLNDFILSSEPRYKLELRQRFFVAQTVARAIGAFHSDGWLHKSIRAHAVKFFFLLDGTCDFVNPYLTDFEFSRPLAGITRLLPQAVDVDHE